MDCSLIVNWLVRDRARLLGFIWTIVRDYTLCEDIFQEVVTLAMQKAESIENEQHLDGWARKTAKFKSLEALRNRTYQSACLDQDVIASLEEQWPNDAIERDEIEYLQACLEELTPRARHIVRLRYMEGLTGNQVADKLKVKVHSIYVALTRSYKTLESCIRRKKREAGAIG